VDYILHIIIRILLELRAVF